MGYTGKAQSLLDLQKSRTGIVPLYERSGKALKCLAVALNLTVLLRSLELTVVQLVARHHVSSSPESICGKLFQDGEIFPDSTS